MVSWLSSRAHSIYASRSQLGKCLAIATVVSALGACGDGGGDPPDDPMAGGGTGDVDIGSTITDRPNDADVVDLDDPTQCNSATQKQWAYNNMRDIYLFADQVPIVNPQDYESPADLVRQLRFQERDTFSNVSNATTTDRIFEEGVTFGLGYRWRYDDDNNARITVVQPESPFGLAGVERGDIITTVNGLRWDDQRLADTFGEQVRGSVDNPVTSNWVITKRDTGVEEALDFTPAQYNIRTVIRTNTYTHASFDGRTGYLMFDRFLNTSEEELDDAAQFFLDREITELVLDLRYNGGGRVSAARQLASIIGGAQLAGRTFVEYRYNNRYTENNFTRSFQVLANQLNLSRVVVMTTEDTVSASEMVINSLSPFMEVVTIGTATTGKPFISFSVDRCDERLNIMQAEGVNANGVSVFGGIQPTCFAADDPARDFGTNPDTNELEGFLRAALDYVVFGTCATQPAVASNTSRERSATGISESVQQGMELPVGAFSQ